MGHNCAECKINEYLEQLKRDGYESAAYPGGFVAPCRNVVEVDVDNAKLASTNRPHRLDELWFWVSTMVNYGCPISLGGLWGGIDAKQSIYQIKQNVIERHWGQIPE